MKQLHRKKKELQLEILEYLNSKDFHTSYIKDMASHFRTSYFNIMFSMLALMKKGYVTKLRRFDEHRPFKISHIAWVFYRLTPKGINYLLSLDFASIAEGLVKQSG